jgi:hypothetical protein
MRTIKKIALIVALSVGIPWSMAPMAHANTIKDLQDAVTALQATVSTQAAQISALQATDTVQAGQISAMQTRFTNFSGVSSAKIKALQNSNVMALNPYVTVDTTNNIENATGLKGPHVIFTGANVHIRSGAGNTYAIPNGLGNLVIGYNEARYDNNNNLDLTGRGGSHNLIVGVFHQYSSFGGFVAGYRNKISGQYSSVSGGFYNTASGGLASVSGGVANTASGDGSSISGGQGNMASGLYSSVSGGQFITDGDNNGWAAGGNTTPTYHSP